MWHLLALKHRLKIRDFKGVRNEEFHLPIELKTTLPYLINTFKVKATLRMILTLLTVVNVCPSIVINVHYTSKCKCINSFLLWILVNYYFCCTVHYRLTWSIQCQLTTVVVIILNPTNTSLAVLILYLFKFTFLYCCYKYSFI